MRRQVSSQKSHKGDKRDSRDTSARWETQQQTVANWLADWLASFNYHCWAPTLKSASEYYFSSALQAQLSEFFFSFSPCPPALFTVLRLEPTVNRLPLAVTPPVKSLCSVPAEGSVGEATSYHHLYWSTRWLVSLLPLLLMHENSAEQSKNLPTEREENWRTKERRWRCNGRDE